MQRQTDAMLGSHSLCIKTCAVDVALWRWLYGSYTAALQEIHKSFWESVEYDFSIIQEMHIIFALILTIHRDQIVIES